MKTISRFIFLILLKYCTSNTLDLPNFRCQKWFTTHSISVLNNRKIKVSGICGTIHKMKFYATIGEDNYTMMVYDEDFPKKCRKYDKFKDVLKKLNCQSKPIIRRILELPDVGNGNDLSVVLRIYAYDIDENRKARSCYIDFDETRRRTVRLLDVVQEARDINCFNVTPLPSIGQFIPGKNCEKYISSGIITMTNQFTVRIKDLKCDESIFPESDDISCQDLIADTQVKAVHDSESDTTRVLPNCEMTLPYISKLTATIELPANWEVTKLTSISLINSTNHAYCSAVLDRNLIIEKSKTLTRSSTRHCYINVDPAKKCDELQEPQFGKINYGNELLLIGSKAFYVCKPDFDPSEKNFFRTCMKPAPGKYIPEWSPSEDKISFQCVYGKIKSCTPNPCQNNGTCHYENSKPVCKCTDKYTGRRCGILKIAHPCIPSPCKNNGTCQEDFPSGNWWCECPRNVFGKLCESISGVSTPVPTLHTCTIRPEPKVLGYNTTSCIGKLTKCVPTCEANFTGKAIAECKKGHIHFRLSGCEPMNISTPLSPVTNVSVPSVSLYQTDICDDVNIPNGHATYSGMENGKARQPGQSVNISCESGYYLNGTIEHVCEANDGGSRWFPSIPNCYENGTHCPKILPLQGMLVVEENDTNVGAIIRLECANNSLESNTPYVICNESAHWVFNEMLIHFVSKMKTVPVDWNTVKCVEKVEASTKSGSTNIRPAKSFIVLFGFIIAFAMGEF